jgi:hypothetical protein
MRISSCLEHIFVKTNIYYNLYNLISFKDFRKKGPFDHMIVLEVVLLLIGQ